MYHSKLRIKNMYNRGDVLYIKGWATYATSVLREKRFSATSLEPLREDKSASVGPCLDESAAPLPKKFQIYS